MKSVSSTAVMAAAIGLLSLAACNSPVATNDAADASVNSVTDAARVSAREMHNQMADSEDCDQNAAGCGDSGAADPAMSGMNKSGMGHMGDMDGMDGMGKMGNMAAPQEKGQPKDAPMPMADDKGAEGM